MSKPVILIGQPTYGGMVLGAERSVCSTATRRYETRTIQHGCSLLAHSFNFLWCHLLNTRHRDHITHFAMLHNDICPQDWWVDTLMEELNAHAADIVSVVVPIKSLEGTTSTALEVHSDPWETVPKLTLHQAHSLPRTFDRTAFPKAGGLLVNTGCWLCKVGDWCERIWFEIDDRIVKRDGVWVPQVVPEDWNFSRLANRMNLKVMATTAVKVDHKGALNYGSHSPWGEETDPRFPGRSWQ
mgnify:CR=1 FL=1